MRIGRWVKSQAVVKHSPAGRNGMGLAKRCTYMPASITGHHPVPERYALVEELVRGGYPDHLVVKMVMAKFECCGNTVRNDLRLLIAELKETDAVVIAGRRDMMRYQLGALQVEIREVARVAKEGFTVISPEGEPVIVQDVKTASMALGTAEKVFARLTQLDGASESDRLKGEILRQKLLEQQGLTPEQLDAMIKAEVAQAIAAMPDAELEQVLAKRKGDE